MPEGDTLHQAANLVGVLVGHTAIGVTGSHRAVIARGSRLTGHVVTDVSARGKHLIIGFDHGWSLRTHLGMTGLWHRYRPGDTWGRTPGKARVIIETAEWVAVCFAAPTVQIGPDEEIADALAHLGPDLLHDEVDWETVVERARRSDAATIGDLLLDQRVMAGIGNVYKSETLFLERLDPATAPDAVADERIVKCAVRAQRLLIANRDRPERSTTGRRGRGRTLWVYGRGNKPCLRCGTAIVVEGFAANDRVTYWCPTCQPASRSPSDRSTVNG